jgi:hypothetical protein
MPDIHKSLRLGDLLVEKGLISAPQLRQAIELQQFRYLYKSEIPNISIKYELGEILIELGFISRHQLASNLSWQRRLKATTAMMVFVAPLLTAACGGGGGGGSGTGSGNTAAQPAGNVSSQVVPESAEKMTTISSTASVPVSSTPVATTQSSSSVLSIPAVVTQSSSSISSVPTAVIKSSSSFSSAPAVVPKSSSSSSTAVSKSSSSVASSVIAKSSSSAASSSSASGIDGAAQIAWSVPTTRENGEYLDITEIGGYEIRYKLKSAQSFTSVVIKDAFIDTYYFDYLKGDYEFEIATFDKTGLYSKFIPVGPSL